MKYVPKAITRAAGRTALRAQKNSPTILFVGGVVGVVGATVLACKATLKLTPVLDEIEKDLIDVEVMNARSTVSEKQINREKASIYIQSTGKIAKLYAPSVVVGVISIGCLTKSHRQLTQRNAVLTGAYVSLQQFLESYRGRVREKIGEEEERNVYYSSTPVELARDGKNGPEKYYGSRPTGKGPYSAMFEAGNLNFQDAGEYNIHFINMQQQILTDKLRAQGYLFLNDVYKRLDIPVTEEGQICGWFVGASESDDYVAIKIIPLHDMRGSLLLDFNVAGVVSDMLPKWAGGFRS